MCENSDWVPKNVGVLGATGTVGQRFIVLLSKHPFFKLTKLGASARSAGKKYLDCVKWKQSTPIPDHIKNIIVTECFPENFKGCDVIFSGLDAEVAGLIELDFRGNEFCVFSNSKNHRRDPACPLVVPLVNPSHLSIIPHQRANHLHPVTKSPLPLKRGFIVTNANCSTTGLVVPLKALEDSFGPLDKVIVTTLQAISGGGYPGVPSLDVLDNVVPFISGEEEKIEWESLKILGTLDSDSNPTSIRLRSEEFYATSLNEHSATATGPLKISATTTRVPVLDGHTGSVSVSFKNQPAPSVEDCIKALQSYRSMPQILNCPSAPAHSIFVHDEDDRPQPRLDRYFQDGAGISVGRVRKCQVLDIKFIVLSNNVSIGAATSSIMNAEIAAAKGIV
ncbi:aspartate-semialdehyde dehydrogenase [Phakopsora pachyrhizi]|uniref:Aspartate-semialdehyde dehydrogenase n=1 Tax=Phakopsora pachyrhizi TaxID=170000 RepID=A0AAV0B9Q1_PHAPC|nr:aspartate-semialdehyde dehydrogenase [Phakopsora pachyrhizi]KAI8450373.1 aspartate-semialdehyde dehydrogenase [Phakopsora pachyrhizi]CAH7672186.1 aspartate-semialdehyde dehydrogenase [Phakopsora pachyrhizi]CAH7683746.1 aspartate-semialdehyde dehydrogenase [Phakopsora pachyrhizi]